MSHRLNAHNRQIISNISAANAASKAISTTGGIKTPPRDGNAGTKTARDADALDYQAIKSLRARRKEDVIRSPRESGNAIFAWGRAKAILAALVYDNDGVCRTDDAETYFNLLMPYYVELAHLTDRMDLSKAMARARRWMPVFCAGQTTQWFKSEWTRLCDLRSMAAQNLMNADKPYVPWLPKAREIAHSLNMTRARRDAINARFARSDGVLVIRGIPVVDPLSAEETREADRLRKQGERRSKGVRPQSKRTMTADINTFCTSLGISRRQWRKAESLGPDAVLALVDSRGGSGVRADKICPSHTYIGKGADTFCPVRIEQNGMAILGSSDQEEHKPLVERFRLVTSDYVKGPVPQVTITTPVYA